MCNTCDIKAIKERLDEITPQVEALCCDICGKSKDSTSSFCRSCRDEMDTAAVESQKLFDLDYESQLMTGKMPRRYL